MEEDDNLSVFEDVGTDASDFEKQKAILQAYIDSVPYKCESLEEMNAKLEVIVGKIAISARAKNWLVLATWDGLLQCWLLMRYPMIKTTRAKLVRLYYELCLLPGIEPRVIRSWADMLSRLLPTKSLLARKLDAKDLQLPWKPLWQAVQKELWPKRRIQSASRNVVNLLLYVAELCKRYFPASDIPDMLQTFLPVLTQDTFLSMIPIIVSFLPPTHTHLYLPTLYKLGEALNSSAVDDRLLDLAGELSEEHVAGTSGDAGEEGGAEWKDIGIWNQEQWTLLMGKVISSLNVPVGNNRAANSTSSHADKAVGSLPPQVEKTINRFHGIAKMLVYSLAPDGPHRDDSSTTSDGKSPQQTGFIGGSKALDSLDRIITSTESYFHPSNYGQWTPMLTTFLQRLTTEFSKRCQEEEQPACKIPAERRITSTIRRNFVKILRTPALLAMFSKDPVSMGFAQGALRTLALLEPNLVMPELLERAYGGLEVVNETHRTTAVLSMLGGISRPLVSEKVWLGGQKHLVPLLELCIPGIDLNDPVKTICTTVFISSVIQHIKIGDLSNVPSGITSRESSEDSVEFEDSQMNDTPVLSREDERSLARDSTAGFADWVTMLFRRVLALYENLPEEGGKKNMTGGKQEEAVLSSIKGMIDVVCMHLSDRLFDLVLNLVYDYATTNAKSNAVRAFSQLVSCLAWAKPEQTQAKFLPFCTRQIEEELKHGASSVRTTSSHAAVPSDTTLHWNMFILRGCLGHSGSTLLKYKQEIVSLLNTLINKTKSERGYSGTGHIIARILQALTGVYPLNSRFVNTGEWESPEFEKDHIIHWGRLYEPTDVDVEWHVPSEEEIAFVFEVLEKVATPALDKLESLLGDTESWDNVSRNDFCRYLNACRSIWLGLPTLYQEHDKKVANPCLDEEIETSELLVTHLDVKAGFVLTDPSDPRHRSVIKHRTRFGNIVQRAAAALRANTNGEDHIDAVIGVTKAIDVYLLAYGMDRGKFDALQKSYTRTRDANRLWSRQKDNSRAVFLKRAQLYHGGRLYMHCLYRRRSELDDKLIIELTEASLSPYTRIRRHAQSVLHNVCGYFVRSTRFTLPIMFDALSKGNDADRIKGALYVLSNKGTAGYALADCNHHGRYLISILECQHEEKPSIQKLVNSLAQDCLAHLPEEAINTDSGILDIPRVEDALLQLSSEFSPSFIDKTVLAKALAKSPARIAKRAAMYNQTVSMILEIASRPTTHWRYVQMAERFLNNLLRRDSPAPPEVAKLFMEHSISPQPTISNNAQHAITKILTHAKMRAYSKSYEELWQDEWHNPLEQHVSIHDPAQFMESLQSPVQAGEGGVYVDKIRTGFLVWTANVKACSSVQDDTPPFPVDNDSLPSLEAISSIMTLEYFSNLCLLWSQESNKNSGVPTLRQSNLTFIKSLAKSFGAECLDNLLNVIDPLLFDSDKFKQRAGAEALGGLLRGSKHWPKARSDKLWAWTIERLGQIFSQVKPDTLSLWETVLSIQLLNRDPRRNQPLVNWILSLPLDFNGDSAFAMTKTLSIFGILVHTMGIRFNYLADKYVKLLFENANTSYAEVRTYVTHCLGMITKNQWQPLYPSTELLLLACQKSIDPLRICEAKHIGTVQHILLQLPKWRGERLPPPRVNQSEYDKVGLTLLQLIWGIAHSAQAPMIFPYVAPMMSEILRMSELNDSSDLQTYSSAVLYVLSAISPPQQYIEVILDKFLDSIKSSDSWRIRRHALPSLVVFTFRNLLAVSSSEISKLMDVLLDCLGDDNVEVREMASNALSGVVRCSQRHSIIPLKNRFVRLTKKISLPARKDPTYADSLRRLHSAILGLCALIESFPYSVEPWMPPLTEILAPHATDPPPISTTIRKCASEFKKTHQDTWHKDQQMFDENQLQSLSTMLVGTSYYA